MRETLGTIGTAAEAADCNCEFCELARELVADVAAGRTDAAEAGEALLSYHAPEREAPEAGR